MLSNNLKYQDYLKKHISHKGNKYTYKDWFERIRNIW